MTTMLEAPVVSDAATTAVLADVPSRPTAGRALAGMLIRELRVQRRDMFGFAVRTLLQPVLFTFVFAYVIPKIGGSGAFGGRSFSTVLVPGLVASTAVLSGVTSVSMGLLNELSYSREIEDRLLTPAPVWLLGVQKLIWGAAQSLLAGLLVLPITAVVHASGQAPRIGLHDPLALIVVALTTPILAAATGLFLGTALEPHRTNVVMLFAMVPAMMLGCVYYPWAALHTIPWLQILVLVNPVVYASEGLRTALVPGLPHLSDAVFVPVLILGTIAMVAASLRSFCRRLIG